LAPAEQLPAKPRLDATDTDVPVPASINPVVVIDVAEPRVVAPVDVVILDNLPSHKSTKAEAILKQRSAWFLFLPPYGPDLNPIEMAFSKLKAHLRRIGARTIDALWSAIGDICALYSEQECWNYFKDAGYAPD
jgi:transposase